MDYTLSDKFFTHSGTGQRMHREDQAIPTALSAKDINALIWSLMEIIKAAGLAGVQFDPDVPSSYQLLLNAIKALINESSSDLPGRVTIFWQPTPPTDWYYIEGDLLSRTANPAMWSYVQTVGAVSDAEWLAGAYGRFSSGDGSTTFRMPDIRGYFFRAADRLRGIDIARALWTVQQSMFASHGHGVNDPNHGHGVFDPSHGHGLNDPGHKHLWDANNQTGVSSGAGNPGQGLGTHSDTSTSQTGISVQNNGTGISINSAPTGISIQSAGGVETRPINLAVPFYMKIR